MLWSHTSHGLSGLLPARAGTRRQSVSGKRGAPLASDFGKFAESFLYSVAAWDFSYITNLSSFFPFSFFLPPCLPFLLSFFLSLSTFSNKTLFPLRKGSHWTHSPPWPQYKHHPGIEQVLFRICPNLHTDPTTQWCLMLRLSMWNYLFLTQL